MLKREVQVKQEFFFGDIGREDELTRFTNLYSIKINIITLRELLLFKSIYYSKTNEAISSIVMSQPNPSVFYKSFLELGGSNFCSMLAFDSRSMTYLLGDQFSKYFTVTYPIFYQNKHNKGTMEKPKYFYRNAVDIALENNQYKAVQMIINYIIKY
jgi:hypothetical protein